MTTIFLPPVLWRESDQREREAGIGPMDPPAPLTRTAPVGHAASFCCSSVWFRPAVKASVSRVSLRGCLALPVRAAESDPAC
jgi:hypothetical protein